MKLGVLFSGGKDSTYALFKAMKSNDIVCLISIISENEDSYMFHTTNIGLTKIQADAIGLPLIQKKTKGVKEEELRDLKKVIIKARNRFKIEGIITGALASKYQTDRIKKICDDLNLKCVNPLWQMNQEEELREIIKDGFKFIMIKVSADGLDESWLGRVITNRDIDRLVQINKKIGINIAFEGGEAETLMIDGPIFKKRLNIIDSEIKKESKTNAELIIKDVKLVEK